MRIPLWALVLSCLGWLLGGILVVFSVVMFDKLKIDDPVGALAHAAQTLGAYVHGGSIVERAPDGRLFNTSLLFSPEGRLVHTYRMVHLFGHGSRETKLLTPTLLYVINYYGNAINHSLLVCPYSHKFLGCNV